MTIDIMALLELAGEAGANVSNTASGIKALRAIPDLAKKDPKLVDRMNTLSIEITDANMKLAELKAGLTTLKSELDTKQEIKERKGDYELVKTPTGTLVYRLKANAQTNEPSHYVCANCFERDQISILQPNRERLQCTNCKASISAEESFISTYQRTALSDDMDDF